MRFSRGSRRDVQGAREPVKICHEAGDHTSRSHNAFLSRHPLRKLSAVVQLFLLMPSCLTRTVRRATDGDIPSRIFIFHKRHRPPGGHAVTAHYDVTFWSLTTASFYIASRNSVSLADPCKYSDCVYMKMLVSTSNITVSRNGNDLI